MHVKSLVTVNTSKMSEEDGKRNCGDSLIFSRLVKDSVAKIMAPYCEKNVVENPDDLEFVDLTQNLREQYEGTDDYIKLPQGEIVSLYSYPLLGRFVIRDGKVFQKKAGQLHHEKRTKKARRMKALPDYPRKKLYKGFKEYAEKGCGYSFDEKHNGYGYYYNPKAKWDWYSIGGRWPDMFLVKDDCTNYSLVGRTLEEPGIEAPNGYRWVYAAQKKDIDWEMMRTWHNQKAAEYFQKLERMFLSGQKETGIPGEIAEDGILRWGGYIYRRGDSVEKHLEKYGIPREWKYPIMVNDIVDEKQWQSRDVCIHDLEAEEEWHKCLDGYLDALDEDAVLVGVDYHI